MKNTLCLKITLEPFYPWSEILVSQLAELNFNSFEEKDSSLYAYGFEEEIDLDKVFQETCLKNNSFKFNIEKEIFPYQNWNEKWENEYEAINIKNKVSITAPFHSIEKRLPLNITIQPKTSFGTGHHPTTQLVVEKMLDLTPFPNNILDMGTGTGVLAILSEKLGADNIIAIDIEDWSVENAQNNAQLNSSSKIKFICGDIDILKNEKFDLILANINKNTLVNHIPYYSNYLVNNGKLIISGFLDSDLDYMNKICNENQLTFSSKLEKEKWLCLLFIKK